MFWSSFMLLPYLPASSSSYSRTCKACIQPEKPAVPSALLRQWLHMQQSIETKISEKKIVKQDTEQAEERSLARTSGGGVSVNNIPNELYITVA